MNLSLYKESHLEKWICDVYQQHGIYNPSDLSLKNVASAFNCEIVTWDKSTKAVWDDEFGAIFLNEELKGEAKREAFFHELGHPFLHIGNQTEMPREFNDYQEEQANIFQLYAAMPIYMIKQLEIPHYELHFIELLSWEFSVNFNLAKKRVNQIKRRLYQAHLDRLYADEWKFQNLIFQSNN